MKFSTCISKMENMAKPISRINSTIYGYTAKFNRWLSVCFLVLMIFGSQVSFGQLLSQDFGFSGALTSNGWVAHSGGGTNPISTTTGLSYTGAQGSGAGNAALVNNLGGEDVNFAITNQTGNGTSVYYSSMVNITDAAATKTGDYFMHIGASASAFAARVYVRITASGVNFGINNANAAAYGTTNFAKNTTYLLIVKYTINTGGNDNASLWVVSSGVPATEGAAGTAESTTVSAGQDNINMFALRQGSGTTSVQTVVDGIRVGTTWADVTVGAAAPVINSSLAVNATVGVPFNYTITALNNPTSFSSSSLPVNGLSLTGAVISGTPTTATAPGTENVNITATNGLGSDNQVLAITVNKGSQTITGLPATDTKTFGDAAYNLTATGGASGNPVTYSASPAGVVSIAGNVVTIVGAGVTTITASQAGNGDYNDAADASQTLTVNQASQTITFGSLAPKPENDPNFQLAASGGGSGNPIVYSSSNPAVAIIVNSLGIPDPTGDWVDIIAAGVTFITATQAGNVNYLAAGPIQQVQVINSTSLLPQTITGFASTDTRTYGDAIYQLTATGGGSGNPVTYQSLNTSVAIIADNLGNPDPNGTYVKIISNGIATLRASQAGNTSYNPAPDVDQVLTVSQKEITVSGAVANDKPYDGTNVATISGYTVNGVISGDNVTVTGGGIFASADAGTHAVTASLILNGTDQSKYYLTQPVLADATINQLTQTITGLPLTDIRTFGAAPYNLTAFGGASGNPVTYAASPAGVVNITGNLVTIVGAGVTTITASQAGNTNYSAADDVTQTLTVSQAAQFITFTALANKTILDAPFSLTGASSSLLTVTYTSSNPAVADVVGNLVTIYGAGYTIITASQAGDANYLPATNVTRTLIVTAPHIAAWDFFGISSPATFAATTFNADLNSSNLITRGATAAASTAGNSFRTTGFKNEGISVANTDYFQVTLSAATGKQLSLSDISAKFNGTTSFFAAPGVTSQFAYSLDGTTFTLIGSPVTSTSLTMLPVDLTGISALQNVTSGTTVTIRYYASGQTTTGGWGFSSAFAGDNGLAFGGTITCIQNMSTANYRTVQSGDFADPATWEYQNGCGVWVQATQPPGSQNNCIIRTLNHADLFAPQLIASLEVESGGSLTLNDSLTITGAGGNGSSPSLSVRDTVTLTHQGRLLDASGSPIIVSSGGVIISEGSIEVNGDMTVNGKYHGELGKLIFKGSVPQVLDNSPVVLPPGNFGEVICDNTVSVDLTGNQDVTVYRLKGHLGTVSILRKTAVQNSVVIDPGATLNIMASSELSVGGDWINNGGTFIPGTGKVIFNGTGTSHIGGTAATETFYDLETSCTDLVNDKTNLNVQHAKITNGKFTGGPGTVSLQISLTVDGSSIFDPNNGTVIFNGSTGQEINGSSASELNFNNLTVDNIANLKVNRTSTFPVLTKVSGDLKLLNGKLVLEGNNNLEITSTGTITGASPSRYIVTKSKGTLLRLNSISTNIVKYPVGTETGYNPVNYQLISVTNQPLVLGARVADGVSSAYDANENPIGSSLVSRNILKTYFASGNIPSGDYIKMGLQWNESDEGAGFNRALCNLGHYTGGQWTYSTAAAAEPGDSAGSYTGSINITVVSDLSPFTMFSQSIANTISGTTFCAGENVPVNYAVSEGIWNTGNIYTAQLSDATGSFASPVNIGFVSATASGIINATIPLSTPADSGYRIRVVSSDPAVTGDDNGIDLTVNNCVTSVTLNLSLFLQGFYDAPDHMRPNIFDLGISADPSETDTIRVNLWSASSLSNTDPDFTGQAILHTDGSASLELPIAVNDNEFYIAVKHRNHMETWSKLPVMFSSTTTYDFSNAMTQAYDDGVNPPMAAVAGGKFAFYGGDVNQDGTVDASDMANVDNDNAGFAFGYNATDASGDGATDASDISIVDNNQALFLFYARPY